MQPTAQFSLFGNTAQDQEQNNEVKKKREEFATEIRSKDRNELLNLKRKNVPQTSYIE